MSRSVRESSASYILLIRKNGGVFLELSRDMEVGLSGNNHGQGGPLRFSIGCYTKEQEHRAHIKFNIVTGNWDGRMLGKVNAYS